MQLDFFSQYTQLEAKKNKGQKALENPLRIPNSFLKLDENKDFLVTLVQEEIPFGAKKPTNREMQCK